ncbi:MAG: helix-hairpin-helix domain-containing protein [Candidatus Limnocylindrus sp.]
MQVGTHFIAPRVVAAAALCTVLLIFIGLSVTSQPVEFPIATAPLEVNDAPAVDLASRIRVEISGGVAQPGVLELPDGSRLIDGISAAGGWGERVDPLRVELCLNLAAPLEDGSAIRIPTRDDRLLLGLTGVECGPLYSSAGEIAAAATGGGAETGATGGKIDLNKATAEELDTLPGIGPATAAKIIASRAESRFIIVDDLRARGLISERVLGEIRALVTP